MRPSILLSLLLATPAPAQWDSIPTAVAGAVHTERFHLLYEAGVDLLAFSAMTQEWRPLADMSASGVYAVPAIQSGHFVSLVRTSSSTYRAYSARLGVSDDVSFEDHPEQIAICVHDDIALIVGHQEGVLVAAAFSGQHGEWKVIELPDDMLEMTCDRFVAGVLTAGDELYGFSARQGEWASTSASDCANLEANGNVLVAVRESTSGAMLPVIAFSGVLGTFATSPEPDEDSELLVEHNVAAIVAEESGLFELPKRKPCAYSAYTGRWTTSTSGTTFGSFETLALDISPNVVQAEISLFGVTSEVQAIGSWPALAWAQLAGTPTEEALSPDALVVELDEGEFHAFSGVRGGAFRPRILMGPGGIFPHIHHALVRTPNDHFHAFSPLRDAWAAPFQMLGAALHQAGAVAVVKDGVNRAGYSARANAWVAGPGMLAPAMAAAASNATYSDVDAALLGADAFVERTSSWATLPAGPFGVAPILLADGNVQVLDATAVMAALPGLYAFGAQCAQWFPAPGFAGLPAAAPTVSGNVAWAIDAAGTLHAFGSPQAIHSMYQYPLDTEFQTAAPGAASAPLRASLRGTPGELGLYLYGTGFAAAPVPVGSGYLCINWLAVGAPYAPFGVIDADGLAEVAVPIPAGLAFHELQTQGVTIDLATFGVTITQCPPEPLIQF